MYTAAHRPCHTQGGKPAPRRPCWPNGGCPAAALRPHQRRRGQRRGHLGAHVDWNLAWSAPTLQGSTCWCWHSARCAPTLQESTCRSFAENNMWIIWHAAWCAPTLQESTCRSGAQQEPRCESSGTQRGVHRRCKNRHPQIWHECAWPFSGDLKARDTNAYRVRCSTHKGVRVDFGPNQMEMYMYIYIDRHVHACVRELN